MGNPHFCRILNRATVLNFRNFVISNVPKSRAGDVQIRRKPRTLNFRSVLKSQTNGHHHQKYIIMTISNRGLQIRHISLIWCDFTSISIEKQRNLYTNFLQFFRKREMFEIVWKVSKRFENFRKCFYPNTAGAI